MAYLLRAIGLFFLLYSGKPVAEKLLIIVQTKFQTSITLADGTNLIFFIGGLGLLLLQEWARRVLRFACIGMIVIQVIQPLLQLRFNWGVVTPIAYYGIFLAILSMPHAEASTRE